jgi:hypothetical protein
MLWSILGLEEAKLAKLTLSKHFDEFYLSYFHKEIQIVDNNVLLVLY